jgi:hypothetical protein
MITNEEAIKHFCAECEEFVSMSANWVEGITISYCRLHDTHAGYYKPFGHNGACLDFKERVKDD